MENSSHVNLLTRKIIKNGERKTANDYTPEITIDNRERTRLANDSKQSFVDALHEFKV